MSEQSSESRGDLDTVEEIGEMVRRFYFQVAQDDVLGPMFNDVARVCWGHHISKLTAFWARALLSQPGYEGNPYRQHEEIHAQEPFTTAHFERWLELFDDTLVAWEGPRVDHARAFAARVAQVHSKQLVGEPVTLLVRGSSNP